MSKAATTTRGKAQGESTSTKRSDSKRSAESKATTQARKQARAFKYGSAA